MNDQYIVDLFWNRDEQAITAAQEQYGKLCHSVAYNILGNREDTEECVNDTYLHAWTAIPPERPASLGAYLCRIARNLAINRYRADRREKRGAGQTALALDELSECVADESTSMVDEVLLRDALNRFLRTQPELTRHVFVQRYWYLRAIAEIAEEFGMTESRVKMLLLRTRQRLRDHLTKEGIEL